MSKYIDYHITQEMIDDNAAFLAYIRAKVHAELKRVFDADIAKETNEILYGDPTSSNNPVGVLKASKHAKR